ncbi:MAG: DUF1189 family protein [Alphaproteobacteria bacterium]|nr:DUF1189 family protein [Alphaproteobacteria bacterium]
MEKIVAYILSGKGKGLLFLFAAAVVVTFAGMLALKQFYGEFRPQLLLVADEFLPITVEKGKIVQPLGVYKKVDLKFDESADNADVLPIVLDTQQESSEVPMAKMGVFIMQDMIYAISPNKIQRIQLTDGVWTKSKIEEMLNSFVGMFSLLISVLMIGFLFVIMLIKTLIVAGIGKLLLKPMQLLNKFDFSILMRLSAVAVATIEIAAIALSLLIGVGFGILSRLLLAVLLIMLFLYRQRKVGA